MMQAVTITILLCAALLMAWLWRPRGAVDPGIRALLIAYGAFAAWTLWFALYAEPDQEPAAFLYWKPTVIYWTLAAILFVAPLLRFDYPIKAILGTSFAWSRSEWRLLNLAFASLFALLGGANLVVAYTRPQEDWTGFKFSCMVLMLFVFLFRLNFVWLETMRRIVVYLYDRIKTWLA